VSSLGRSGPVGLGRVRLVPGLLERLISLGLLRVLRVARLVGLGRVRRVPGLLERLISLGLLRVLRVARLACYGVVDLGPAVARLRWGGPWAEGQARGSRGIGWGGSMIGDDGCGAGGRPPDRR
jgi:hypothetical protein